MKIAIWLLLLQLIIIDIYCFDRILSQFYQTDYKVRDIRVELLRYSKTYYHFLNVRTFKYNRTTPAVNSSFQFKIDVGDQMEILVQGYKFLSNEYRHFPIRYQVGLKNSVDANAVGLRKRMNCGNVSPPFFKKDITYVICNYVVDETYLPPLIPNGRYKIDLSLLYLNEEMAVLCAFGEVYTPIEYPKK